MQVSATLIAAQQAAREAQARFHANHVAKPAFAAVLEKTAAPGQSFSPLPLQQTAPKAQPAPDATPAGRLGTMVDIRV